MKSPAGFFSLDTFLQQVVKTLIQTVRRHGRAGSKYVGVLMLLFVFSSCSYLVVGGRETKRELEGNAMEVEFQRSPSEALADFRSYVQGQRFEVIASNSTTIQTGPGSLGPRVAGARGQAGASRQEVRLKAVVEPTDEGSRLTVIADYLDASTGDWQQAYVDFGTFDLGGREARTASNARALQSLRRFLVQRYGDENVEATDTDAKYDQRTEMDASPPASAGAGESKASSPGEDAAGESASVPPAGERPGNGGEDVAWVQRTLNELGHDCGIADGVMGSNTRSCIRSFQEANGLDMTGKINEDTYEMMLERR